MKKRFTLDCSGEVEFSVLAINSHAKGHKLCWNINNFMHMNFEKVEDQTIENEMTFSRYKYSTDENIEYNIVTNRSKKGYLIPDQKSVNYFLIINNQNWAAEKKEFISKLKENKEVLLVFEIEVEKCKYIDRFIFNDKKD
jgi:hypothetical protein